MWKLRWSTTVTSTVPPMRARAADRPPNPAPTTTTRCMLHARTGRRPAVGPTRIVQASAGPRDRAHPIGTLRRDRAGRPAVRDDGPARPRVVTDLADGRNRHAHRTRARTAVAAGSAGVASSLGHPLRSSQAGPRPNWPDRRCRGPVDLGRGGAAPDGRGVRPALGRGPPAQRRPIPTTGRHPDGRVQGGGRGRPGPPPGGDRAPAGAYRRAARALRRGDAATRARAGAVLHGTDRADAATCHLSRPAPEGDPQPGDRPAQPADPGPVGRAPAEAGGGDGRHARALRLLGAGDLRRGHRPTAPRPGGAPTGWQERRRRRQGPDAGVPRRQRSRGRGDAAASTWPATADR